MANNHITEIPILGEQDNRIVLSELRILDLSQNPISVSARKILGLRGFKLNPSFPYSVIYIGLRRRQIGAF